MEIIIVTGMSGSGKSTALNILEDLGYYAMDNLPPKLMVDFIELSKSSKQAIEKVAIVTDIRGGILFDSLISQIEYLSYLNVDAKLLFLDADDDTLVKRYKELRRPHPLSKNGSIERGIKKEREILEPIKEKADLYIDTSNMNIWEFRKRLTQYINGRDSEKMIVNITSFGYKHGILKEADIVMDVRFIPNPFYISELKNKTGLDREVKDFVFSFDITKKFIDDFSNLIIGLIPESKRQGKQDITIGIGCTGGRHRSVVITEELARIFSMDENIVNVFHRDEALWN